MVVFGGLGLLGAGVSLRAGADVGLMVVGGLLFLVPVAGFSVQVLATRRPDNG